MPQKAAGFAPMALVAMFITLASFPGLGPAWVKSITLALCLFALAALALVWRAGAASPISKAMTAYLVLAAAGLWLWPTGLGAAMTAYPAAALYVVLFLTAFAPPLLGKEPFTTYFAKQTTPQAVWQTDVFKNINIIMTRVWAGLFAVCALSALASQAARDAFGIPGLLLFQAALPVALLLGVGVPFNKWYPAHYQRKAGIEPIEGPEPEPDTGNALASPVQESGAPEGRPPGITPKPNSNHENIKERKMSGQPLVVAVNGSPHQGIGNTSLMLDMLSRELNKNGVSMETIMVADHDIKYCVGCAFCLERGKCWIKDDHAGLTKRLLDADALILAAPVYFMHVPAQMKTFIDRGLAFGHKPRSTWKPGLAVSVSAGYGETGTADYLSLVMRAYGAYSIGEFTAQACRPAEFLGKEAVERRAEVFARELAEAIDKGIRYPAHDMDRVFYQFMGELIKSHKDTVMKHDYKHWREAGLYEGFEAYVQQHVTPAPPENEKARQAWMKTLMAEQKHASPQIGAAREPAAAAKDEPAQAGPHLAASCRQLLEMMPLAFNPEAAGDMRAVVQFEVGGSEDFVAHLKIADRTCTFEQGPAPEPDLVVETPADVWLAVSKGEMDGQAAFMGGKYKASGDITILMRFKQIFDGA